MQTFAKSLLAIAVLGASMSASADDQALKDFIINEGTHTFTATGTITNGSYIRNKDGIGAPSITIESTDNVTFDKASFVSQNCANYTEGVTVLRGKSIGLYNKDKSYQVDDPDHPGEKVTLYPLFTDQDIDNIFAQGDEAVQNAFNTKDGYIAPESLTADDVKKALHAANNTAEATKLTNFVFTAEKDLTFKNSTLHVDSLSATKISSQGHLKFDNSDVLFTGGGATTNITADTLSILSGNFQTIGSVGETPFVSKFDDRQKIDRNRWTLGESLNIMANEINFGSESSKTGPNIVFRDGMIMIFAPKDSPKVGNWNIYGGTMTLDGQFRSTLISDTNTIGQINIHGGTINIISSDRINRVKGESASMFTAVRPVFMQNNTLHLINGQFSGAAGITIESGTYNLMGDSAIFVGDNENISDMKTLTIKGGTFFVDTRSFIGAIKGDSKEYSAYPTSQKNIAIEGGQFTFQVNAPAKNRLTVGKDIGGIHATKRNATITISDKATFAFNTASLAKGSYEAKDFVSIKDQRLSLGKAISNETLFYKANIAQNGTLTLDVKDASAALSTLTHDAYLADNAQTFGLIAQNSSLAQAAISSIWQVTDTKDAATNAQIANTLHDIANTEVASSVFAQKHASDMVMREVFRQSSLVTSPNTDTTNKRVWATPLTNTSKVKSTSIDMDTNGIVLGADHSITPNFRGGVSFAALHTKADAHSHFTSDIASVGLYASYQLPVSVPVVIDTQASYAWGSGSLQSSLLNQKGSADIDTESYNVAAKVQLPLLNQLITPYMGLEYTHVSQDSYHDAALNRSVASFSEDALTMPVGVTMMLSAQNFTTKVDVAYARDLTEFDPRLVTLYNAAPITSSSSNIGRDAFRFAASAQCDLSTHWNVEAKYAFEAREHFVDNQLQATLRYNF